MGFLDNFTNTTNSDNRKCFISQQQENTMTIGSSTTHTFSLPFIYSQYVNYCEVIYKQGVNIILIKTDFTVQEENSLDGNSILKVELTQDDTCKFKDSTCDTFVQIKIINKQNEVSYSYPTEIKVINSLDSGRNTKYGYLYKNKITDYLYEIAFDNLDYDFALNYYKKNKVQAIGGCTSIRWDGYLGRNQDWYYGNKVAFIVRTPNTKGRYATIGIADLLSYFEVDTANDETDMYKIIPFGLADGINEKGLCMSINAVPSLNNKATQTIGSKFNDVSAAMLVRYCLDNFESVEELKRELPQHTSIFNLLQLSSKGYEQHWLIADANETTILEIINNKIKFIEPQVFRRVVMTNFHLNNVIYNDDRTVYSPIDVPNGHKPTIDNNIEKYGVGLERYNYAINKLRQVNGTITEGDMRSTLNGLAYTKAYPTSYYPADPAWYTEFVGEKLTVDSAPTEFTQILEEEGKLFENRERGDGKTWFTSHSSIYDINGRKLYLVSQEDADIEYMFKL